MANIDDTQPCHPIEIEAMRIVNPILWENISDANITVTGGIAARLREGLRGSVIESDLQSLFCREDGVNLLTGSAMLSEALAAFRVARLPDDLFEIVSNWGADAVSVHFIDARL